MLEYLQKFKSLPQELRDAVSGGEAVAKINELESRFGVSLADIIIRLMVKDIALMALPATLVMEQKMDLMKADELFTELKSGLLAPVLNYLNNAGTGQTVASSQQINTVKSTEEIARSPFYFDPEDEADVRKFSDKASSANVEAVYNQQARDIVKNLDLTFGSELLLERLYIIIATYLSGVRNRIDTKLAFNKSIEQGGVNLDEPTIDNVFKAADEIKSLVTSHESRAELQGAGVAGVISGSKEDLANLKAMGARDFEYDLGVLEQGKREKGKGESGGQESQGSQDHPGLSATPPYKGGDSNAQEAPKTLGRPRQEKESFNVADSDPFAYRRPKETVGKIIMSDVKVSLPKVMGPIDELHYLDLIVFRRLAKTPEEAVLKIKDKFDLLEAEMFSKKLDGIKVWRLSPIYSEYLKIAEAAVNAGKTVADIINEQASQKGNSLSLAEFEAIMKLNRELRF